MTVLNVLSIDPFAEPKMSFRLMNPEKMVGIKALENAGRMNAPGRIRRVLTR
jgi:hypothetical protein